MSPGRLAGRPFPSAGSLPSAGVAGRGTPATALLARLGIAHSVHVYDHDPRRGAYGLEASDALGVAPERVFKTLVAEVDGALTVGVVPVAGQLDLKALAAAAGGKRAAMAGVAAAERATGYVAGGISPLGQRKRLPVVVDSSALGFATDLLQRRPPGPGDRARARRPGAGRWRGVAAIASRPPVGGGDRPAVRLRSPPVNVGHELGQAR